MNPLLIALIVLGALLLLVLLLFLFGKASIRLTVKGQVRVFISVLGYRRRIFPVWEKGDKPRSEKAKKKAAERKRQKRLQKEADKAAGMTPSLTDNLQMITSLIKQAYRELRGRLSIRFRRFRINIGTGDAATTAILYGSVLTATSLLLQWVDASFTHIDRNDGDVALTPDYLADKTTVDIDIVLGMRVCQAVGLALTMFKAYDTERTSAKQKAAARRAKKKEAKAKRKAAISKLVSK